MKGARTSVMVVAMVIALACTPTPTMPLAIRIAPDPNACPAAALPLPLRFRIDPSAQDQVVAIAADGKRYQVWWAPGFSAGDATNPVIRDPTGAVVAHDGDLIESDRLHGYQVCASGDSIYILLV